MQRFGMGPEVALSSAASATALREHALSVGGPADKPRCLLINLSDREFERSAASHGWACLTAETVDVALACLQSQTFQWVVLNVQGDDATAARFRRVGERCTELSSAILTVFGSEVDSSDEIWARQMGIWFYLSGMPDSSGFAWLCREAQDVAGAVQPTAA